MLKIGFDGFEFEPLFSVEKAHEIFASARLPIKGSAERANALYRTARKCSSYLLLRSTTMTARISEKKFKSLSSKIADLDRELKSYRYIGYPPPQLMPGWQELFSGWVQHYSVPVPDGAPPKYFRSLLFSQLLALYKLAFDKRPGLTVKGPAMRFMESFVRASRRTIDEAEFPDNDLQKLLKIQWHLPTEDSMREAIRLFNKERVEEDNETALLIFKLESQG